MITNTLFSHTNNPNFPQSFSTQNKDKNMFFVKNLFENQKIIHKNDMTSPEKAESQSSNASCDTSMDESLSICSKESIQALKYIHLHPYSSIENVETRSVDSGDHIKPRKKVVRSPEDDKYKTEMCKKWIQTGTCSYGIKCRFAHGKQELQEKVLPNKRSYKSKKCHSFYHTMYCPYGIRCMFAHESRNLKELVQVNEYEKYISFPELLYNPMTTNKKRLIIFRSLLEEEKGNERKSLEKDHHENSIRNTLETLGALKKNY